jgi:hypothetical protein
LSIDAMHWVWTHSRSKGNVRLVLLAVADKAPDAAATARMGTTEFRARLNAPKSTVVSAVDKALESGELVMVAPAVGSRAATYQLPHAVGYTRPAPGATGPDSGPLSQSYRSGIQTPSSEQGSENRTPSETATGPDSGPGGSENETPRGPESGPLNQTTPTRSGSKQAGEPAQPDLGPAIPTNARPLVDALTAAGVLVRWNLSTAEWFVVEALIQKTGIPALAAYAQKQAAAKDISYAKYFLPGWRELPPLPEPGTARPALRAVAGGWQPYQNPTDHSVYENGW